MASKKQEAPQLARTTEAEEIVAQKKQLSQRDQELADVRQILTTKPGVRFFRRLIAEAAIFNGSVFTGANGDFMSGRRNMGLKFYADALEVLGSKGVGAILTTEEVE